MALSPCRDGRFLLVAELIVPVRPFGTTHVLFEHSAVNSVVMTNSQQSRQAEYVRLTALPVWARTMGKLSGGEPISHQRGFAIKAVN